MTSSCPRTALTAVRHVPQLLTKQQTRCLTLHEYQSQQMLKEFEIPTPRCGYITHPGFMDSVMHFQKIEAPFIVRPQALRKDKVRMTFANGLTGNGTIVKNNAEARAAIKNMLNHRLQIRDEPSGDKVPNRRLQVLFNRLPYQEEDVMIRCVYISEILEFTDEWYLALTIDRETFSPVILVSKQGGCDLEQIMEEHPDSIIKYPVRHSEGIRIDLVRRMAEQLEIPAAQEEQLDFILRGLWEIFVEKDATHLEINPLARLLDGELTCVSSCFVFDDAALPKHDSLRALRDFEQEVPEEAEAERYGLNYVRMEGNIGSVVNGAGLAMATNDAVTHFGGESANFLDIGAHVSEESMAKAFDIMLRDEYTKVILVNIYGGTTDCIKVARCLISAVSKLQPLDVPVVVRFQGTNSHRGLNMLKKSKLRFHVEGDFRLAVKKAVSMAMKL